MNIATSELKHLREEVKNCHRIIKDLQKKREFVGLTPEQIQHRIDTHIGVPSPKYPLDNRDLINFALVIADELKGNNT